MDGREDQDDDGVDQEGIPETALGQKEDSGHQFVDKTQLERKTTVSCDQ